MNSSSAVSKSRKSTSAIVLAALSLILAGSAIAQTSGTWNVNANGNWSATGSWLGGIVPNGAGGTANFNFDINADRTVTIDTTPRVIGNLLFRDGALGSNAYILGAIASTNVFTLDNGASKPRITLYPRAANALIARIDQPISGTNGMELVSGDVPGVIVDFAYGNVASTYMGSLTIGSDIRFRLDHVGNVGAVDLLKTETVGLPSVVNFTEIYDGGTLNTNNKNLGTEYVKVQGSGAGGAGAIINSGAAQQSTLQQVELTGNATFGGANRWDIRTGTATTGRLFQSGFALTKVGANQISLVNVNVIGGGDININQGIFGIEVGTIIGGGGTINVNTGGNLNFWNNTAAVTRNISANGGAINHPHTTLGATIASNIALTAPTTIISQTAGGSLTLNGILSGVGGITRTGGTTVTLGGANTFTGPITITGGTLAVAASGSLSGKNAVTIASGAVFSFAPAAGHTIGAGKTLTVGRTGATPANDIVGSVILEDNTTFEIGASGRNGGLNPVSTATIAGDLTLGTGCTIYQDLNNATTAGGGVNDLIACANLTMNGTTTVSVTPIGGGLAAGSYTLMTYSGTGSGLGNLQLGGLPAGTRQMFALDTSVNGVVSLVVTGAAANLTWVGNGGTNVWDLNMTPLWDNAGGADVFRSLDAVIFDGSGSNSPAIDLVGNLSPGNIVVTGANDYIFAGTGVLEDGAITKTGSGKLTIAGDAHTYASSVQIKEGSVSVAEVNDSGFPGPLGINATLSIDGGTLEFTGTSQNVNRVFNLGAGGATVAVPDPASRLGTNQATTGAGTLSTTGSGSFLVGRDDAAYTFNTPLAGSGNIAVNPHMAVGSTASLQVTISTIAPAFTGNLILAKPASGSYRTVALTQTTLANTSRVVVEDGAQLFLTAASNITSNATISGIGYLETNGTGIGALRIEGSTVSGNVDIVGSAAINAHNGTGTVAGSITGGTLLTGGTNFNNNYTLVLTGANSYGDTIVNNSGTGVNTSLLRIGDGGATGTLGSGPVTVNGDTKTGILRFSRSDGYTLGSGQTITAGGTTPAKAFLDLDVQGSGFDNNGQQIDFTGGNLRSGVTVANTISTLTGTVKANNIQVGILNGAIPTTNATLNIASGASVTTNNMNLALGGGTATFGNTSGANVTIASGATVAIAANLFLGDQNTSAGSVTQNGGDVSVGGQFRIGHWPNATSTYTMNGGSLLVNGTRTQFPQAGSETAGGIYVGVDGSGNFNHTAGTVTTGWVVLDNRGDTAGVVDTYDLTGGELILSSADGIISRNGSTLFNWNGGKVTAGANFNLDSNKITLASASELDTDGNTVTLLAPLSGTALLSVTGGGTLVASNSATAGFAGGGSLATVPVSIAAGTTLQSNTTPDTTWVSVSDSGDLIKTGAGKLTLTGDSTNFNGTATVTAGTLAVDGALGGTLQVDTGAILAGSGSAGATTVASGGKLEPGASVGTLNFTSLDLENGSDYRVEITGNGSTDNVNVTGTLTANGTISLLLVAYTPSAGDIFNIADAGAFAGVPSFSLPALPTGLAWDVSMFAIDGTISVFDTYEDWAADNGLVGGDALRSANPDGDDFNNLMEFALNGDPTSGNSQRRFETKFHPIGADTVFTLTFAARQGAVFAPSGATQVATRDGIVYTLDASDEIADWLSVTVTELAPADAAALQASLALPTLDAGWEWRSFRTDGGLSTDPRDFIRLNFATAP